MIAASLALVLLVAGYFLAPYGVKILLTRRLLARVRQAGAVCLTFDDGPDPRTTPQILGLLQAAGAKATFFILGRQAQQYPELVRQIERSGHAVGEHGHAHRHAWRTEPIGYTLDLLRGRKAVGAAVLAGRSRLYRPAYGEINLITLLYMLFGRRRLVMWDLNPRDFDAVSGAAVAQTVSEQLRPGNIVLLHDARADIATDPQVTIDAVRLILDYAKRRKLPLMSVAQALSGV